MTVWSPRWMRLVSLGRFRSMIADVQGFIRIEEVDLAPLPGRWPDANCHLGRFFGGDSHLRSTRKPRRST